MTSRGSNDKIQRAEASLAARALQPEAWKDTEWQKLWLSLRTRTWSSMAVVPAGTGAPPEFALTIAVTLARIGTMHLGEPIQVADATKIPLVHLMQFSEELARLKADNEHVLIALAPIVDNPIGISIAQTTDAAMLCILLEHMSTGEAKDTIERIGNARFVGSAVFHGANLPTL